MVFPIPTSNRHVSGHFILVSIAIGCTYWLFYGMKLEEGAGGYSAVRGTDDDEANEISFSRFFK